MTISRPANWQKQQEEEQREMYRQKGWPHKDLKSEDYPDEATRKAAEDYWKSIRDAGF